MSGCGRRRSWTSFRVRDISLKRRGQWNRWPSWRPRGSAGTSGGRKKPVDLLGGDGDPETEQSDGAFGGENLKGLIGALEASLQADFFGFRDRMGDLVPAFRKKNRKRPLLQSFRIDGDPLQREVAGQHLISDFRVQQFDRHQPVHMFLAEALKEFGPLL